MSQLNVNKFEISDMMGMNTLAFLVEESEIDVMNSNKFYSLQKLEYINKESGQKRVKEFNVIMDNQKSKSIVLLTLTSNKAVITTGVLDDTGLKQTDDMLPLSYGSIYNQDGVQYKEFAYAPNMKRCFSIIDTSTSEEVKPTLYVDEMTNEVRGKCKLLPLRPYVILEVKGNYNRGAVVTTDGKKINSISHGQIKINDKLISKNDKEINDDSFLKDESIV